jgi:transglutaminase-like putative cysteine protease
MTDVEPQYLLPSPTVDSDHAAVVEFARKSAGGASTARDKAVAFYYAVRDGIRYDLYDVDLSVEGVRASTTLSKGRAWCVPKAALLAGCCRVAGIPARVGFADVRNHLSTDRVRRYMKTDVFCWHGYTSIYLGGVWVKATPAFNIELCERFRLKPLDFDGGSDALLHPADLEGKQHMEYIRFRGEFPDVPVEEIADTFRREYPGFPSRIEADFDLDLE